MTAAGDAQATDAGRQQALREQANKVRLGHAQCVLLDEIADAGVLYVQRYKRYHRTVTALLEKGMVEVVEPDYSILGMDGYSLTDLGRARNGRQPDDGQRADPPRRITGEPPGWEGTRATHDRLYGASDQEARP